MMRIFVSFRPSQVGIGIAFKGVRGAVRLEVRSGDGADDQELRKTDSG